MGGVQLASLDEDLDDHQRGRDRERHAHHDRAAQVEPEGDRRDGSHDRGGHDLQHPAADRDAAHRDQVPQRELYAEGEEEEDDPDVGEGRDLCRVADEAGREGADDDPGDEVADDRRLAKAGSDRSPEEGGKHRHTQVQDEPDLLAEGDVDGRGHAPIIGGRRRESP